MNRLLRYFYSGHIERFIKFCLVGGSGVVVDMAVLHVLADPRWLDWNISLSKVVAAEVAILNNFAWNDLWTFREAGVSKGSCRKLARRFIRFNIICSIGVFLAVLLLNFFYRWLGINLYVSNFLAIVVVTLWNFWMNSRFNWQITAEKRELAVHPVSIAVLPSTRGFTLIELLVVIAIIGILSGLILPALAGAKQRGQGVQCLSNVRQLQTAWTLFVGDHEDNLPPSYDRPDAGRNTNSPSWVAG